MLAPAETLSHALETVPAGDASLWTRPVLERQLALLGRLAEAGLEIAVALERQAKGEPGVPPAPRGDIALAYARVARAVRLTIALQTKLIGDFQAFQQAAARASSHAAFAAGLARSDPDRKAGVEAIMARVIGAGAEDPDACEALCEAVSERLDDETLCDDLSRLYSEIVAGICRDLGLTPDWSVLSQEAWARAELASGRPGAPLADLDRSPRPLAGKGDIPVRKAWRSTA